MVELRTLHLTDIHDDWEKYEVIAQYVAGKKNSEQAVDAVFITGDFIEGDFKIKGKTAQKVLEEIELLSKDKGKEEEEKFKVFVEKHQTEGKIDVENLDDAAKKELNDLGARMDALVSETIKKTVSESYRKHAEAIDKIDAPVSGILGNHDLTYGYDILKDKVKFVEKEKKVSITGKRGLEFILKGDLNIIECPPIYAKLAPLLEKNFIPYHSGYSLSELSKAENTLQKILSESPNDRLENIRKGEKPEYSDEQLQLMEKQLKGIQELRPKVLEYNQSERRRLGDKTEADIYLTHKLPSCKKARPDIDGSLSDVTAEYAANTNAVYGGHFHDGQIGYKTIDNFLKQESTEKTVIDGVEVPVYYLDENEPWELNPGTKYFFVTEYDAHKKVEQVVIHEFYYEEAA